MLPSLSQLPIGTFIKPGLRDGTTASLEAISQLDCSICYQLLGDGDGWLIPCVNQHAFHRQCLINWVVHSAPLVGGLALVKCPDCTTVLTYPYNDNPWREIKSERHRWPSYVRDQLGVARAPDAHGRALPPPVPRRNRDEARDREFAKKLSLLDWWSATFDGAEPSPSVVDPDPTHRRRIQLYPSTLTQVFEFTAYGPAEKQRRSAVAERSRALYEAAWTLVKNSVYGFPGMELLELRDAEERNYGGSKYAPPSRELKLWIDEYRVREREALEDGMAEGVAEEIRREWANALRYIERGRENA